MIFGLGLLGRNVIDALNRRKQFFSKAMPYSWGETKQRALQNMDILKVLTDIVAIVKETDGLLEGWTD